MEKKSEKKTSILRFVCVGAIGIIGVLALFLIISFVMSAHYGYYDSFTRRGCPDPGFSVVKDNVLDDDGITIYKLKNVVTGDIKEYYMVEGFVSSEIFDDELIESVCVKEVADKTVVITGFTAN